MRRYLFLFFILLGLFSSICLSASYYAIVLKVSDGDTVWVLMNGKKVKLRLLGIDTPEKFSCRKLERDAAVCGVKQGRVKNLGQLATHHAKELLKKGQKVTVIVRGYGYYGRPLAVIILPDGTNFNETMVKGGYACVYKYHGHKSKELSWKEWERLNQFLKQAKKYRRGLWAVDYRLMECLCR